MPLQNMSHASGMALEKVPVSESQTIARKFFGHNVARSGDDQHFPVVHERHVYGIDGHKSGYCVPREPVKWIGERGAKRTPRSARLFRKEKRERPSQATRGAGTAAAKARNAGDETDQMAPPGAAGPKAECRVRICHSANRANGAPGA